MIIIKITSNLYLIRYRDWLSMTIRTWMHVAKNASTLFYAEIYYFDIENLIDLVEADR